MLGNMVADPYRPYCKPHRSVSFFSSRMLRHILPSGPEKYVSFFFPHPLVLTIVFHPGGRGSSGWVDEAAPAGFFITACVNPRA